MPYIGNPIYQSAFVTDQFSGNGSTVAFTMSVAPAGTSNVLVAVSGVLQDPSTYGVSGNTLTFSAAPPSGTGNISCRYLGVPVTGVATTAYRTVTAFTATASQTTFTPPSYTVNYINVYRNGVLLTPTSDYTATNGTTVVLATGATAGDTVIVESFLVTSIIDAIPTTGGTITGNLFVTGVEFVGTGAPIGGATNPLVASSGAANNYVQTYVYNNTNGASSSADFVAYPSNGADSHGWADMGITSPSYSDATYSVTGPNEAYLFGSAPSGAGKTGNLVIATDSTGTTNAIQFYNGGFNKAKAATSATINAYGLGLGTAVPSSGVGIAFPATQSSSSDANTLDDYEEGTWTATPNTNLTVTNNVGRYTKVGNIVTCSAWMGVSAVSSTNTVEFALPFTNATNPTSGSNITICPTATYSVTTGDAGLIGYVDANYAGLTFLRINSGAAWTALINSALNTSSTIAFTITYRTA